MSTSTNKLEGKIALVTGGNSGIGLATAQRFVAEGAHVFITGRRQKELDAAVAEIGANTIGVQGDVSNLADLDRLYATIKDQAGKLDVVFANAGVAEFVPLDQVTEEHYDRIFNANVRGLLFTVQKALPLLTPGASILLNASVAGSKGFAGGSVYSASKAAVRSFARAWMMDLKDRGIRVNVISPGPIQTPIMGKGSGDAEKDKALIDQIVGAVPLGRIGQSEEIAAAAVFLASSEGSFVNGAELFVDGGLVQV